MTLCMYDVSMPPVHFKVTCKPQVNKCIGTFHCRNTVPFSFYRTANPILGACNLYFCV